MSKFENELRGALRRSESELDQETTRELSQLRQSAISNTGKSYLRRHFALATGMTLASALALVLVLSPGTNIPDPQQAEFLSGEGVDLYENMDFYLWLAEEDNNLRG